MIDYEVCISSYTGSPLIRAVALPNRKVEKRLARIQRDYSSFIPLGSLHIISGKDYSSFYNQLQNGSTQESVSQKSDQPSSFIVVGSQGSSHIIQYLAIPCVDWSSVSVDVNDSITLIAPRVASRGKIHPSHCSLVGRMHIISGDSSQIEELTKAKHLEHLGREKKIETPLIPNAFLSIEDCIEQGYGVLGMYGFLQI